MCRGRQSPAPLLDYRVRKTALDFDVAMEARRRSFLARESNCAGGDEALERPLFVDTGEAGNRMTVIGDDHIPTHLGFLDVTAQVIAEISDADLNHRPACVIRCTSLHLLVASLISGKCTPGPGAGKG